jgi:putative ABC transport system ATP-binding protein
LSTSDVGEKSLEMHENNGQAAPLLKLSGIRKVFHGDELETHALSDVHLEIRQGEYVAIEGPSGSGKTTLLSILGLLELPSAGSYWLKGHATEGLVAGERARIRNREIGFIFQSFNLIGDLTVFENAELPLLYRGLSAAERRERVTAALSRVQMTHTMNHLPSQLSGGQQQRVAVARAVVGEPGVLLADEPTGSLDSKSGDAVMDLLDELHAGGATICIVTHNHDYARRARRAIHLFDGRVVDDLAPVTGRG